MPQHEVVEQFPVAEWRVPGANPITFSVISITEEYSNRLAKHRRIHRDGARIDDTGGNETIWTLETAWWNRNEEPGVAFAFAQYPDIVNEMTDACKIHETGDLVLPTRGPRRCRLDHYTRSDTAENRDFAGVTFVFVEDNEDDATQQEFSSPSASSITVQTANEGVEWSEANGAGSFDMSTLNSFAADLEALANAPGEFVGDLEAKADAIVRKVEAVEAAFTRSANNAVDETTKLLTAPESSLAGRRLRTLADAVKTAAAAKAGAGVVALTSVTFGRVVSVFDVATIVGQASELVIPLNSKIGDLMEIPVKTPVVVFDTAGARNAATS